ncbi:hypothetical protein GGG16DRAFT_63095 [Schizophyllum commune]
MDSFGRDDILREFARISGLSYNLNPRNFEDRWYALWLLGLNKLCDRLDCYAIATAQDSIWPENTRRYFARLAGTVAPRTSSDHEDTSADTGESPSHPPPESAESPAPSMGNQGQDQASVESSNDLEDESDGPGERWDVERVTQQQAQASGSGVPAPSEGHLGEAAPHAADAPSAANDVHEGKTVPLPPFEPSASAQTMRGGNKGQLVPDSAINGYFSFDFTPAAMKQAIADRQLWTTDGATTDEAVLATNSAVQKSSDDLGDATEAENDNPTQGASSFSDAAQNESQDATKSISNKTAAIKLAAQCSMQAVLENLKKQPPRDPEDFDVVRNPIKLYHGFNVVEFKLVNCESKRLPSRQESKDMEITWDEACEKVMTEAQLGNLQQIRIFFDSPHWRHQDDVLLLATSGDFYTYSIATRKPKSEGGLPFKTSPWSLPTWAGSEASKRREEKIVEWLNTTFSNEAMEAMATKMRDQVLEHLQKKASAQTHAGSDPATAQPGPSQPPVPALPPSPPQTRAMKRKLGDDGSGKAKGKGKARADASADAEQDLPDDVSPLDPIPEADEDLDDGGSESDEEAPLRKKARNELPSPCSPPRSTSPSSTGGDAQRTAFASTQPSAPTFTQATASTSTQPAASTSTQPAASTSTQPAASTSTQPAASTSSGQPLTRRQSIRQSRPVRIYDVPGKKDAEKNKKLKRARTMN